MRTLSSSLVEERPLLRLFVITGVRLYREGLVVALGGRPEVTAVAGAGSCQEALAAAREFRPDIALLDMSMVESAETARVLTRLVPTVKIVGLAVPETESDVLACAEAGVAGYVPRDGSLVDLVTTLRHVARGETVCSPQMAAVLMRRVAALTRERQPSRSAVTLTRREREIVDLISAGMANREIARELGIELCTVKNHVHNILEKLGVRRRTEVVGLARAWV
ncbi:LuxR C-terminal-related transcriptional regulator [Streptoalloteichus hindustanus]|uniref:Two component transcriptional regulator, LuxR family n=1 Tax=Streptoalloteichus hindustanus TaxID=2017 RepID=A0A1M5CL23_STRHI|nr:response regulator transcription factor [Streptoalloteichus hindustanus]SHF55409.1 two component transcriptional regulator, LuxR family [Streptoalloteichus hindustanus]